MDRRRFILNTALCSGALYFGCACSRFSEDGTVNDINKINYELPSSVKLESCTMCQLHCPECWRSRHPNQMPLGYLKFEDFKQFVDDNDFIRKIDLTGYGEMFLNPDLNKIIKYAKERNIELTAEAGVNLNEISDETAELLVTSNFGKMIISIDGASQETYSIYRRGGDFNKVIENIKKIQFYQKKHNDFEHPKLVWKFIVFGHNEHEIPKAKQMAKKLHLPLRFDINYEPKYSPIKDKDFVEKGTKLNYNHIYNPRNPYSATEGFYKMFYERYQKSEDWFYCTTIFDQPNIFYDGKLLGCCMGYYYKAPEVNVFKTGLKKALTSKELEKIIDVIAMKTDAKGTMCEGCDILKFLKDNNTNITKDAHLKLKRGRKRKQNA